MFNFAKSMVRTVSTLLLLAALVQGCGGGSSEAPVNYPRDVTYKTLNGVVNGKLFEPGAPVLYRPVSLCTPPCLNFVTALTSKEALVQFVDQAGNDAEDRPSVLAAGASVDFSREQLWVLRYMDPEIKFATYTKLVETESQFELQYRYCYAGIDGYGDRVGSYDVFLVVSNNLAKKPVVAKREVLPTPC